MNGKQVKALRKFVGGSLNKENKRIWRTFSQKKKAVIMKIGYGGILTNKQNEILKGN